MPLVIPPRSPKSQTKGDRIGCYIKNVYSNVIIKLTWYRKSKLNKKIEDLSLSNLARINVYNDLPQAKRNPWISISALMQPCSAASSPLCTDATEFCDAILLWAYACVSVRLWRRLRACWCECASLCCAHVGVRVRAYVAHVCLRMFVHAFAHLSHLKMKFSCSGRNLHQIDSNHNAWPTQKQVSSKLFDQWK